MKKQFHRHAQLDFTGRHKRLIWRGAVQNAVSDPTKISQNLAKQVERIVEQFPQVRG